MACVLCRGWCLVLHKVLKLRKQKQLNQAITQKTKPPTILLEKSHSHLQNLRGQV